MRSYCLSSSSAAFTLTRAISATESFCFTVPGRMVPPENDTSMESAVSTASSGTRTRISPLVQEITTPEYWPVVSMGLSNQSVSL